MVADEDHFDLLVVLLQEQIQQDEETFGDVLVHLGHRPGHIHQAEHHGTGGWLGLLHVLAVPQVNLVNERDTPDIGLEIGNLILQGFDLVLVAEGRVQILRRAFQRGQLFLHSADFLTARATEAKASGMGAPQ